MSKIRTLIQLNGADGYRNLADETIILMRNYKNEIENAAAQQKYLR